MPTEKVFDVELFFSALADNTRLRLLNLLRGGEVCVCVFADTLATNNPKISRHLAYLKRAGLVAGRREGKWMHYRLSDLPDDDAAKIFRGVLVMLENDPQMKADIERLNELCCAPAAPIEIRRLVRSGA